MSKLASTLADVEIAPKASRRKAPCFAVYGDGDQEDYEAVQRLRDKGVEWIDIQAIVDSALGVDNPIGPRKFVRHWRRECSCWSLA